MDNTSSSNPTDFPLLCAQGCGFFGNPMFQNMCSKCFKDTQKQQEDANKDTTATSTPTAEVTSTTAVADTANTDTSVLPATTSSDKNTALPTADEAPSSSSSSSSASLDTANVAADVATATSATAAVADEPSKPDRPVQSNPSRCFVCRAKLTMAKQIANKCRCDYVFCDSHKPAAVHECDFDYKEHGKIDLVNITKKGGNSFNRMD